ncbi:hypothetical protein F1880_007174 [Penicillium rolfsii]|nr:hypothetical protein F1880_007174 [Penicillium rolfsii]
MEYSSDSTTWPISQPSPEVKQLIYRLFALVDRNSPDVGQVLADEIFAQDAVLKTSTATFKGASEISHCRDGAGKTVKARQHTILKCYVNDANGTDIVLIGKLNMEKIDGLTENEEFVVRINVEEQESGPRISKYHILRPVSQVPQTIWEDE